MKELKVRVYQECDLGKGKTIGYFTFNLLDIADLRMYINEVEDSIGISQYTELKDKNGKEIYEGDIIKTDFDDLGTVEFIDGYYYIDPAAVYESSLLCEWCNDMGEVVGNIYENPELLKRISNGSEK